MRKPAHFRCLLAAIFAMLVAASPAAACEGAGALPSQASPEAYESATLCVINEERAGHGLKALKAHGQLGAAARKYAGEIVATGHFAHRSIAGESVLDRVSAFGRIARWARLGENLGVGTQQLATPRALVDGWMGSPTHRAVVLGRYTHVGVGIVFGHPSSRASEAATYATAFGQMTGKRVRQARARMR